MDSPALDTFKVRLGGTLGSLIQQMSLLITEGLNWVTFKGSFQPQLFCDYKNFSLEKITLPPRSFFPRAVCLTLFMEEKYLKIESGSFYTF